MDCHQVGVSLQHNEDDVLMKKTKGVAKQCMIQSKLADAPIISALYVKFADIN